MVLCENPSQVICYDERVRFGLIIAKVAWQCWKSIEKWCTVYPTQDYVGGRSGDGGRGKAVVEAGVGGSGHLTESWSSYRCLGTSFSSALPPLGHTPQIMPAWEGHAFREAGKKALENTPKYIPVV